ncbi:MAG TPA: lysophospholipid acyltransferase family protein [Gemmatimonadales bacterium]
MTHGSSRVARLATRDFLQPLLCSVLKLFYRRIEVTGREHLPADGPVVFVLNHPNSLMDPLVLLCRAGRPVSFLAKEPLFRTPLVGALVRAMDSIPVWRRMDQADTTKNQATFAAARALLGMGGSLALFPEGQSHDAPRLLPFRTGAARIALGAAENGGLDIVPAGLFYTEKDAFRSSVLLVFGPSVHVDPIAMAEDREPPPAIVRPLTQRLEDALGRLTLQADRHRALRLVAAAEEILRTADEDPSRPTHLAARFATRQRLLEGYHRLRLEEPQDLDRLERRLVRYHAMLRAIGLTPALLPASGYRAGRVLQVTVRSLLVLLLLLPAALAGIVVNAPAWFVIQWIARRYARRGVDVRATYKVIAGLILYPLTWTALAVIGWLRWGILGVTVGLMLGLPAGLAALLFLERLQPLLGGARGVALAVLGRRRFLRLLAERRAIRDELRELAAKLGV